VVCAAASAIYYPTNQPNQRRLKAHPATRAACQRIRDAFMAVKQDLLLAFVDCVERNGAKLATPRRTVRFGVGFGFGGAEP